MADRLPLKLMLDNNINACFPKDISKTYNISALESQSIAPSRNTHAIATRVLRTS